MVRYANPNGHDWGSQNRDGYAYSLIGFAAAYSLVFFILCAWLWCLRKHPIIKMRKIGLVLSAVMILHVYVFMVFMVYPLNGIFPCDVEYWIMSLYLPLGMGLFQAQNQQLLLVSRAQTNILHQRMMFKTMPPSNPGLKRWMYHIKMWWIGISEQGHYEGFVFFGMIIQFIVSLVVYCLSRRFHSYGIVSEHVGPGMCRRGWEWFPSIVWQFAWNWILGPVLLWKIRMIRDIYHWRLQTTIAVVAGLLGSPLWLVSVYSDSFTSINKYWVPAMWFLPGLMTMQIMSLVFPIAQVVRYAKRAAKNRRFLKSMQRTDSISESVATDTTKRGKLCSMKALEQCLAQNADGLYVYASAMELSGENVLFLLKVSHFEDTWFPTLAKAGDDTDRARKAMFRLALCIYITLVEKRTATYPVNIDGKTYNKLEKLFGDGAALLANRSSTGGRTPASQVTPWDDPVEPSEPLSDGASGESHRMETLTTPPLRSSVSHGSCDHIISMNDPADPVDPLRNFEVPLEFKVNCFNEARDSVKIMVWGETWQRYMQFTKRTSASTAPSSV